LLEALADARLHPALRLDEIFIGHTSASTDRKALLQLVTLLPPDEGTPNERLELLRNHSVVIGQNGLFFHSERTAPLYDILQEAVEEHDGGDDSGSSTPRPGPGSSEVDWSDLFPKPVYAR
jgi:hypothetical protein